MHFLLSKGRMITKQSPFQSSNQTILSLVSHKLLIKPKMYFLCNQPACFSNQHRISLHLLIHIWIQCGPLKTTQLKHSHRKLVFQSSALSILCVVKANRYLKYRNCQLNYTKYKIILPCLQYKIYVHENFAAVCNLDVFFNSVLASKKKLSQLTQLLSFS